MKVAVLLPGVTVAKPSNFRNTAPVGSLVGTSRVTGRPLRTSCASYSTLGTRAPGTVVLSTRNFCGTKSAPAETTRSVNPGSGWGLTVGKVHSTAMASGDCLKAAATPRMGSPLAPRGSARTLPGAR